MADTTVYAFHRVEPISREGDPGRGLAAPVHDPLWLLARQWEFGELAGEDAGTPIQVDLAIASAAFDGWSPLGDDPEVLDFDPGSEVLEAVVAGEAAGPAPSVRDRIDAGRRLVALLPGSAAALVAKLPVTLPASADRQLLRAAARFPDGLAAAQTITGGGSDLLLADALGIGEPEVAAHRAALEEFCSWAVTTFGLTPNTWVPERLERRFGVRAAGVPALVAGAHTRLEVDLPDVDLTAESGQLPEPGPDTPRVHRVPLPLRFPGMPNDRFWAFEDAQVALHRIDAATHDLARLALVEFSTVYGNDWFTFPIPVTYGSVVTVREIVVRDTFGTPEKLHLASDPAWSMFEPSRPSGVPSRFVVPPVAVGVLSGPVTEEVAFVRDENANLVWALEKIVTDTDGGVHDLVAEYAATVPPAAEVVTDAEVLYRLMTDVPEHWVPFVPVHLDAAKREVGLVEAVLPRPDTFGDLVVIPPRSSILQELRGKAVREEEVPSEGITVRRRWQLARSADGGRHAWAARSVEVGRGEGSSGLAFDVTVDLRGV